ncbi:MAG: Flp pilus assembly protein CpaB [Nitriliruptorales bacterium]
MAGTRFGRRGVAMLVALALAATAALALLRYVRDIESEALADAEQVEVYVAKDPIPAGTPAKSVVSGGLAERRQVAKALVPAGALTTFDGLDGDVTSTDLLAGELLLRSRFVPASATVELISIPEDRQAMSVEVAVPPGVAGFLNAGDHVSVIASVEEEADEDAVETTDGSGTASDDATADKEVRVAYLLQDIELLAVGQRMVAVETTDGEEDGDDEVRASDDRVLVTLAVTPQEAEQLAFAVLHGEIWLTLLPDGQTPVQTDGRTRADVFTTLTGTRGD